MAQEKKKKKFFEVEIPIIRGETHLEAYEPSQLEGKIINYDLTRMLKGKGVLLQLRVRNKEGKLTASPIQIKLMQYFLRRMVRKGTNYVEDSFSTEAKDSIIRVKPFLVTRRKVARSIRKALRDTARRDIVEYSKDKSSEILFEDVVSGQMQKALISKLKKVYPLSLCEIRILKVEKSK